MRRALGIVLAAVAATAAATSPAAIDPPRLGVVDLSPVTVQGLRFPAGQGVRVVLDAGGRYVRTTRAGRNGSFTVRFAFSTDACVAFNVRARSAAGAVATVTKKSPAQCAALDPLP